jgi:pimeloyl-ACP methyl ester carboxylesterase
MARARTGRGVIGGLVHPVIVVPGITASGLRDEYRVDPEPVWSLVRNDYERVALHPDDPRYELREPARMRADQVLGVPYRELIRELRHDLSPREDQPTPVFPFAYDWRQPLARIETQLARFVEEVIARTALLPHYHKAGYREEPRVNLVGHSMGGLVIAGLLASGGGGRVGKVASLGSPFRGSLEAVVKITTGLAELGPGLSSSRDREAARLTPALYHLAPKFRGCMIDEAERVVGHSFFEPGRWQRGVVETLAEFIRLHGLESAGRRDQARALLDALLGEAARHRRRIERLDLRAAGLAANDWLCVVGIGRKTRVRVRIRERGAYSELHLTRRDQLDEWRIAQGDAVLTGDGTVPYRGAEPPFLPVESLVCVAPEDFGSWELGDRILAADFLGGFHGLLPQMNLVHRLVSSHFEGIRRRGCWGRASPALPDPTAWIPPIAGLEREDARA